MDSKNRAGYISIPVKNDLDEIMKWFSDVYVGERIDFRFPEGKTLVLYNVRGNRLEVRGYGDNDLFKMLAPDSDLMKETSWQSVIDYCEDAGIQLKTGSVVSDMYIYYAYLREKPICFNTRPAWFVRDIKVEGKTAEELTVLLSITPFPAGEGTRNEDFDRIKNRLEDDLWRLYDFESGNILIPRSMKNRKPVMAKMFLSLKGRCEWIYKDDLSMINEWILKKKYPHIRKEFRDHHPGDLPRDYYIEDVTYQFPPVLTWADILSLMGLFTVDRADRKREIWVCQPNIKRTVLQLQNDPVFQEEIVRATEDISEHIAEKRIVEYYYGGVMGCLMEEMVVRHELGHMVFREVKDELTVKENESLANWFSCLFVDDLERRMIELLCPHQSEDYHEFIVIPKRLGFDAALYDAYCRKIELLLRSW